MGLPIEKWVRQATLLDTPPKRVMDDVHDLATFERGFWLKRNRQLVEEGELVALQGGFAGLPNVPPSAALANVTSINGSVALWTSSLHSPINANAVQAPQAYRFAASGLITTGGGAGNIAFDPRAGAGSTINTAVSGTTMGAGTGVALVTSVTVGYRVEGDLTIRSIGAPGANSTVICFGTSMFGAAAFPSVWTAANIQGIGGTAASVDLSVAGGFSLGLTTTITTITPIVTHQVHWASWN